ncbi:MAG: hypothetical protein J6Y78_00820 [Paludibacteraceae bacterium]|nr:hypothetical protein [Paludibacteraceae bacterium]
MRVLFRNIFLFIFCLVSYNSYGEDSISDIPRDLSVEEVIEEEYDDDDEDVEPTSDSLSHDNVKKYLSDYEYENYYGPGKKMEPYRPDEGLPFFDMANIAGPSFYLIIGLVIFLIVIVLLVVLSQYRRKGKRKEELVRVKRGEKLEGGNLNEALNNQNYKEAIRIVYVETLIWLNDHKLITWEKSKTPIEYYYEMSDVKKKECFKELTRIFLIARYDKGVVDRMLFDNAQENALLIIKK